MAESLQFWVGLSSTLAPQRRITKINSANINLKLNDAGSVSLVVDRSDLYISFVATPISNCILVYRNGFLVWSGPIWTIQETYSGENRKVNVTAVGWFELLNHRLIRSQPGYSLTASGIAITNSGFESALSGWSATRATATRSTLVFDAGAASLLIAENQTGPFGNLIGTSSLSFAGSSILGSAPTAAKKYRLNFRHRSRKNSGFVSGLPYAEVLESGNRVGYVVLNSGSSQVAYDTVWDRVTLVTSGSQAYESVDTANFKSYSMEWVSNGTSPEIRFSQDTNPTQFINGDCSSLAYWRTDPGVNMTCDGVNVTATTTGSVSALALWTAGSTGVYDTSKVYKITVTFSWQGSVPAVGSASIADDGAAFLGSVDCTTGVVANTWTTKSFTFTPTANQPLIFYMSGGWSGSYGHGLAISEVIVQENATDTDNLMNVDVITLQEYAGDGIYSAMDAGAIATALLQKANSDGATKLVPGSVQVTQPRTITYQQFSNVGKEIKSLSEIESGYDFVVDPFTRELDIYNRTNATNFPVTSGQAGAGSWIYSADRSTSIRFEYGIGSDNLSSITKTQDSSTVINRLNVKGKYALGFAQDAGSQSTYGIFEDLVSLPEVIDASTSVLPFYANAEVAFKKNPKILYDIQTKTGGNTPRLFIDFNIGDRATLNVGANILATSAALTQQIRIFGVQLSVDAEGNEQLSGLQLSA